MDNKKISTVIRELEALKRKKDLALSKGNTLEAIFKDNEIKSLEEYLQTIQIEKEEQMDDYCEARDADGNVLFVIDEDSIRVLSDNELDEMNQRSREKTIINLENQLEPLRSEPVDVDIIYEGEEFVSSTRYEAVKEIRRSVAIYLNMLNEEHLHTFVKEIIERKV